MKYATIALSSALLTLATACRVKDYCIASGAIATNYSVIDGTCDLPEDDNAQFIINLQASPTASSEQKAWKTCVELAAHGACYSNVLTKNGNKTDSGYLPASNDCKCACDGCYTDKTARCKPSTTKTTTTEAPNKNEGGRVLAFPLLSIALIVVIGIFHMF